PRPPVRLPRGGRTRGVASTLAVSPVLLWVTAGPGAATGAGESRSQSNHDESVVDNPDETLWEIASDIDPTADPRLMVQRIMNLNGMADDPTVLPGQELRIPSR